MVRTAYVLLNSTPWPGGLLGFVTALAIAFTVSSSPTKQGWYDLIPGRNQVIDE
ncbi:hypothetical protein [Nocardia testacea]|uniref:hypothetical protein n=1 Tax=Nocardia testacea TaxID=248551 RepID=UPI00340591B7